MQVKVYKIEYKVEVKENDNVYKSVRKDIIMANDLYEARLKFLKKIDFTIKEYQSGLDTKKKKQ